MRTRRQTHRFQRAAGWCKAVRQGFDGITSELRTEPKSVGCAGERPITRNRVPFLQRNKSGTAEVIRAFVSYC